MTDIPNTLIILIEKIAFYKYFLFIVISIIYNKYMMMMIRPRFSMWIDEFNSHIRNDIVVVLQCVVLCFVHLVWSGLVCEVSDLIASYTHTRWFVYTISHLIHSYTDTDTNTDTDTD